MKKSESMQIPRIILDTDIAEDCDDVGAVAVLNALADLGETEILAMIACTANEYCAPCLQALNTYYGRPDIPIGTIKNNGLAKPSRYNKQIANEFPNTIKSGTNALDAVELYRKILASQPDNSVIIVSIGFLTNLSQLLKSKPDSYSDKNGIDLVNSKVKFWVCMGGIFPSGTEYNFNCDLESTRYTLEHWPTAVVFSGFEIGEKIKTGAELQQQGEKDNPVRRGYELYKKGHPRSSWDQTAVLYAVRGKQDLWNLKSNGTVIIRKDNKNDWVDQKDGNHAYLQFKADPQKITEIIGQLML